jgi:endonuclease/exonuclease/phosphatase family metal-dependent hydrolase
MTEFKVMTWNVENLFLPGSASGAETTAEYAAKLQSLSKVILAIEPDVLGLQEIGDLEALAALQERLDGRYPHEYISQSPDRRGIRVGFLSKFPIAQSEEITTFPADGLSKIVGHNAADTTEITAMSRGAVRIAIELQSGRRIHLINAHFKSKLLSFTSATGRQSFQPQDENERARVAGLALLKRTAEAIAVRVKANELLENNSSESLILLGDFNDTQSAATTQILQGPTGSEIGTVGFKRSDEGDDTRLFNLAALIPTDRRYSRIYQGSKELIDHILVSKELLPGSPRQLPTVDSYIDSIDSLPSINDNPTLRHGKPGSDHLPIVATFEL